MEVWIDDDDDDEDNNDDNNNELGSDGWLTGWLTVADQSTKVLY